MVLNAQSEAIQFFAVSVPKPQKNYYEPFLDIDKKINFLGKIEPEKTTINGEWSNNDKQ